LSDIAFGTFKINIGYRVTKLIIIVAVVKAHNSLSPNSEVSYCNNNNNNNNKINNNNNNKNKNNNCYNLIVINVKSQLSDV